MSHPIDPHIHASEEEPREDISEALRGALGEWPAGVVVVTTEEDGRAQALTVTSFAPVSLEPPLVLICLHADAPVTDVLLATRRFGVSLLEAGQKGVANRFSDRLTLHTEALETVDGVPVVRDAVWSLVCDLHEAHVGGTHRIAVGRVHRVVRRDGHALLYLSGGYRPVGNDGT